MPPAVRELGLTEYRAAHAEMRRVLKARQLGEIPDTLLLVEHPPVVTVGVEGAGGEELPAGIPIVQVERGGRGTYHGPGQMVGYPIVDLDARGRDVRRFVHDVEELVVEALAELEIPAGRVAGKRGVWVDERRKIASVGLAIESWVSYHGFALNVSTDLAPFRAFHPCGLPGTVMTSVSEELGRPVRIEALRDPLVRAWERRFAETGAGRSRDPIPAP